MYLNGMVKECERNGKSLSSIALCLTVHCGLVLFFPAIFFLLLLFLGGFICTMTAKDSQEADIQQRATATRIPHKTDQLCPYRLVKDNFFSRIAPLTKSIL